MVRTKVKLQFIANNTVRRSTLKKRQLNLLKKLHEISVLCGVDACGIVYNPEEPTEPQVFPQPQDATQILMRFYDLPETERTRKMINHLAYVQERVATLQSKIVKRDNDNDKLEVRVILYEGLAGNEFVGLTGKYLWAVVEALDKLIAKVYARMSSMSLPPEARDKDATDVGKGVVVEPAVAPAIAAPATPAALASEEAGPSNQEKRFRDLAVGESGETDSDGESEGDSEDDDDE